ncbi:hypothetical protein FACS1894132_07470 [Clostridia bacterium]|nr:hypothetical protein FACS1894132_07470 [Clostridia bacterium]
MNSFTKFPPSANEYTENEFRSRVTEYFNTRIVSHYPTISKQNLSDRGIILYGCAVLGKFICDTLLAENVNIDWIVDKDSNLTGTYYHGVPIRSLDSLSETNTRFVMLCSTHIQDMINTCKHYGVNDWIFPASTNEWLWLCDFGITSQLDNLPQRAFDGFSLLADKKSRLVYDMNFQWYYLYNNDFSAIHDSVMYFPDDLAEIIDYSNFCDVGAYDGDILKNWVAKFAKETNYHYTAIEPDVKSYEQLVSYVNSLAIKDEITTMNCAVGETNGTIQMTENSGKEITRVLQNNMPNSVNISLFTIDEIFKDKKVSFIKADVEGHEMPLLLGALQTIKKQRPSLAISTYHRFSDIWELPMWVKSLNLDYDIYLRHFPKVFTDTVMFAIPR